MLALRQNISAINSLSYSEAIWCHINLPSCLLLLISMVWYRQAIFESKGDKLSSSAESRIRTHQGLRHQIASRLNAHWQTDWAIEDQAKKLELDSPSLWSASIQPTIWVYVYVMACRMFATKPLPEPIMAYPQFGPPGTNFSEFWNNTMTFLFNKCI